MINESNFKGNNWLSGDMSAVVDLYNTLDLTPNDLYTLYATDMLSIDLKSDCQDDVVDDLVIAIDFQKENDQLINFSIQILPSGRYFEQILVQGKIIQQDDGLKAFIIPIEAYRGFFIYDYYVVWTVELLDKINDFIKNTNFV